VAEGCLNLEAASASVNDNDVIQSAMNYVSDDGMRGCSAAAAEPEGI